MNKLRKLISSKGAAVATWTLLWIAAIDLGVNLAFAPDASLSQPSALSRYFEYGRSVEGKLARMVAADPKRGGQMVSAGWANPEILATLPSHPEPGHDLLMAVYGQSFALIAAKGAAQLDSHITIRGVGGPGAPPSHSYASYKADVPFRKADVVVLGVLSASVVSMRSLSGLIWMFESPAPYTFPYYRVVDGNLVEELPVLRTEAQFRDAFVRKSSDWSAFKAQLQRIDYGYDHATFDATIADESAVVRLLRRGWVAHRQAYEDGVYTAGRGFNPQAESIVALRAMLVDLERRTRERKERLVVLLLHNRGHADHLHGVLAGTLERAGIEYISTHTLFSANDPSNFLPDGHYAQDASTRLSKALLAKVRSEPPSRSLPLR